MVERMIGARKGTGGTSGLAYLQQQLFRRVLPDAIIVTQYLLPADYRPQIPAIGPACHVEQGHADSRHCSS